MKYELKKPCKNCPFRKDGEATVLTPGRARQLREDIGRHNGATFACHKTLKGCEDAGTVEGDQHCAGALALNEKDGVASQMARIMERLGMYDLTALETGSTPDSWDEWVELNDERYEGLGGPTFEETTRKLRCLAIAWED